MNPAIWDWQKKRKNQVNLLAMFPRLPCPIRTLDFPPCSLCPLQLNNIRLRPHRAREQFRKTLWRVDAHASDGLAVESAEMGFVAGKEGLAPVLDGGGEHEAVFFRKEQGKAWRG